MNPLVARFTGLAIALSCHAGAVDGPVSGTWRTYVTHDHDSTTWTAETHADEDAWTLTYSCSSRPRKPKPQPEISRVGGAEALGQAIQDYADSLIPLIEDQLGFGEYVPPQADGSDSVHFVLRVDQGEAWSLPSGVLHDPRFERHRRLLVESLMSGEQAATVARYPSKEALSANQSVEVRHIDLDGARDALMWVVEGCESTFRETTD